MNGPVSGNTDCNEVCVLCSLFQTSKDTNTGSNLYSGIFFYQEYKCLVTNDIVNVTGNFNVDGEIYAEGYCANASTE